jgi:hypothetical protein
LGKNIGAGMKMKKNIFYPIIALILLNSFISIEAQSQIKSMAGAFSRMGFDAKGLSMGNSIVASTKGIISPYYNPAGMVFQDKFTFNATYTFLNLDRNLNTFSFILPVKIKQDNGEQLSAAISGGLINAGVSNIDGRDFDGFSTQTLSTFEDQFYFAAAIKFTPKLAIGATFKFNYAKLYENVTSSGFGVDAGILYQINEKFAVAASIKDINTSYEWDTSELYGQSGNTTKDKFPLLKIIGAGYKYSDELYFSFAFENSNQKTNILKFGGEYSFNENFSIRAGIDRLDLSNTDNGIKPAFGFSYSQDFNLLKPTLNYVFAMEPFTHYPIQMLTLTIQL